MGRKQTIDREKLLQAAEHVITTMGAAALSLDAVAQVAQVTKGGIQYAFGSKDALVDAVIERWSKDFNDKITSLVGENPDPITLVRAHVGATRELDQQSSTKVAGLMVAFAQRSDRRDGTRAWYHERLDGIDCSTAEGRRARLALLAAEGAFLLHCFGFFDDSNQEWHDVMDDIQSLLEPESSDTSD